MVEIARIERTLSRFGERFVARCFTPQERTRALRRVAAARPATFAKRFAAKEACAKALGTGISRGVFWRDMGVVNKTSGAPGLVLTGGARATLMALIPSGFRPYLFLTLSDERRYVIAHVTIEARPESQDVKSS